MIWYGICEPKVECFQKKIKKIFQVRLSGLTHPFTAASVEDVAYGRFGSVIAYSRDTTNKKVMTQSVGESATLIFLKIKQLFFFRRAAGPTNLPTRDRNEASHDRGPQCRARPGAQGRKAKSRRTKRLDLIIDTTTIHFHGHLRLK